MQFLQASDVWSVIEITPPTRKVLEKPASTEVREAPGLAGNQIAEQQGRHNGKERKQPVQITLADSKKSCLLTWIHIVGDKEPSRD